MGNSPRTLSFEGLVRAATRTCFLFLDDKRGGGYMYADELCGRRNAPQRIVTHGATQFAKVLNKPSSPNR